MDQKIANNLDYLLEKVERAFEARGQNSRPGLPAAVKRSYATTEGPLRYTEMVDRGTQLRCGEVGLRGVGLQCPRCGYQVDAGTRREVDTGRWKTEDYAARADIVGAVTAESNVNSVLDAFVEVQDAMTTSESSSLGVLQLVAKKSKEEAEKGDPGYVLVDR